MINWNTPWATMWQAFSPGQLRSPRVDEASWPGSEPLSAREAWTRVIPSLHRFDTHSSLRSIEAPNGAASDGTSLAWVFHVDIPSRKAQGVFEWRARPDQGLNTLSTKVSPFPEVGSHLYALASSGVMPARWVDACWDAVREMAVDIPQDFVDSSEVMKFFADHATQKNGESIGMKLTAQNENPEWVVQIGNSKLCLRIKK